MHGSDVILHGFFVDGVLRGAADVRIFGSLYRREAEAAFSIEKPWQSLGIGAALLERSLLAARNRGVKARVARVWKVARASVYRSLKETPPNTIARRPGPVGACSDAELADHIRRQIAASHLHGEGYRKLWARLRFAGVRASPRRVARTSKLDGTPTALRRTISCRTVRAIISRHPITKPRPAAQPRAPSDAPGRAIGELRAAK